MNKKPLILVGVVGQRTGKEQHQERSRKECRGQKESADGFSVGQPEKGPKVFGSQTGKRCLVSHMRKVEIGPNRQLHS